MFVSPEARAAESVYVWEPLVVNSTQTNLKRYVATSKCIIQYFQKKDYSLSICTFENDS